VQVSKPDLTIKEAIIAGYRQTGTERAGAGAEIALTTDLLQDDSLIIVQALKSHFAHDVNDPTKVIESKVIVKQAAAVLVRPNPAPQLALTVEMEGDKTTNRLLVENGQTGIFYYFRVQPDGDVISLPAYFHKMDDSNPALSKGVDQLKLGVDFVVTRTEPGNANVGAPSPSLVINPIEAGSELFLHAMKAQTRVAISLAKSALIESLPDIHLEKTEVESGELTQIKIIASHIGDKYRPFWDGELQRSWKNGNGNDITFNTPPITADMGIEMFVMRDDDSIAVTWVVKLFVKVQTATG